MNKRPVFSKGKYNTLIDILLERITQQPDKVLYTFLLDGETEDSRLTYGELDRQARAIAVLLKKNVRQPGERILLLYPPGLDYISAFWGCLYAGMVAVPSYPPRLNRPDPRLQTIALDAQAQVALTTPQILASMQQRLANTPDLASIRWLTTDGLDLAEAERWEAPRSTSDSLAFLQYTSGSTAQPKGVMVSHGNLVHNLEKICQFMDLNHHQSQGVTWLPSYHDMGLIGILLEILYLGITTVIMPPTAFLQKPARWLQAISRYRGTYSGGPNFAYEFCIQKMTDEQKQGLDLSSWRAAFNGAEPIRNETLERFAKMFEPYGFRREAFYPCYGLAEATLIATGGTHYKWPTVRSFAGDELARNHAVPAGPEEPNPRQLVSSGLAAPDQNLLIVDPQTLQLCPDNQVGEIWLAGPSIARGYWNRPEETVRTFQAHLANGGEGPFMRTGDLGFIHAGEVFIAGRAKDLIIIRGRNHYPQDIEVTVEGSHPAVVSSGGAAFSVEGQGEEKLVIVQEVDRHTKAEDLPGVIAAIHQAVVEQHELQVYAVVLIRVGSIPKTSSGKIQRRACKAQYLDGGLSVIASSTLTEEPEDQQPQSIGAEQTDINDPAARQAQLIMYVREQVARILHVPVAQIDPLQPLNTFGLDSMMAVEMAYAIEAGLQVSLPMEDFIQGISVSELVARIFELKPGEQPGITPAAETPSDGPLSHGQRALWFIHQLAPDSAAYNIHSAMLIHQRLDVPALQNALQALVERHPALRTTFHTQGDDPIQRVAPQLVLTIKMEEISGWNDAQVNDFLLKETQCPFDLGSGPLMRVTLFSRSINEHILLFVVHHIIVDFWSLAIFMDELGRLYTAATTQTPFELAPLTLRYSDYVRWQSEILTGAEGARLLTYWQQKLSGDLPILDLPTDCPRPQTQTYFGGLQSRKLSADLTGKIKNLSQQYGATLYMTLLAAFQVLLHRYTGQGDILVGSPTAGRSRAELARLMGYFINPVVLRADLSENPPFRHFLAQVRQTALEAFAHQDYPFGLLVEHLQSHRDPSRSPIFQAMFVLQKAALIESPGLASFALGEAGVKLDLNGLSLESMALEQLSAQFDLTLAAAETANGLGFSIEYNRDLFDPATIQRMLAHLEALLDSIVAQPDLPVDSLPMLPTSELHRLLVEWNATEIKYPQEKSIHELFEAQVEKKPEAVAVVFEEQKLTYAELNTRANQLAHYLHNQGVGPDVLVGICVERSLEMIVGLLGILKAGGAYLPLDPAYPQERLAYMLSDARPAVLLTQQHLQQTLPVKGFCLDSQWNTLDNQPRSNPKNVTLPGNLAYVIYTSGSTGRPKGSLLQHANVTRLFSATDAWFRFDEKDTWTLFHSYAFDFSVWEIWGALLYGGKLIIVPYLVSRSPDLFRALLAREKVTILNQTPSAFQQLVEVDLKQVDAPALALRKVIFGGEALNQVALTPWFECHGYEKPNLINMYGITETCVHVTYHPLQAGAKHVSSIGRPIPDLGIYLLDADLNPVPIGVPGELCITGDGLARGYLNRPDLTAEKFVPNPFHPSSENSPAGGSGGGRMYRSGDLARYLPDGNIEYLGRIDSQIKIRGFRVELGEIEAIINQHPAVRSTVVIAREDIPGNKRLVAYLVSNIAADRVPFQSACQVKGDDGCALSVMLEDISCNGACLGCVPDTWEVGQQFHVSVSLLPTLMEQCLPGEVIWKQGNRVGFLFEISLAEREVLRQNIVHLSRAKDYTVMDLRRLSLRVPLQEIGQVKWDDDQILEIHTVDVSWNGACIKGLPGLDKHQGKHLRLKLPFGSDGVWLDSKLVWQRDDCAGLRFETTLDGQALLHKAIGEILVGENLSIGHLTAYLRKRLPGYMIPSAFVFLNALPLTPNGKIDRKALPIPDAIRSEGGYTAPRNPMEEQLAHIWAAVLNLDKVGVHDNFFELGGHSLLAIKLIERMRQLKLSVDIRTLFTTPTIATLATAVHTGGEIEVPPNRISEGCQAITPDMLPLVQLSAEEIARIVETVPGGAANIQDIYPLAPLQEGILFHHLMSQTGDAYLLRSLLGFDSREHLERFVNALQIVVNRHDILRTAVVWDGLAQPIQVVWRQAQVIIEEVSFDADGDIAQQISARYDPRHTRLDVCEAPMLRGIVTEDYANNRWLLHILTHHLINDHTTLELLFAEVQAILQGREEDLPTTFPFRNFVAQARLGIPQAEHEAFFTEMLSQVDEPTAPFGLLDIQGDGSDIQEARLEVDPELSRRLRQQARRLGVSAASLVHLAWAQVLARTTGREEVVFGTVLFGRLQGGVGADRVMGMFINTLPICIPVKDVSVQESIHQTHKRLTQLLRHEHASLTLAQRCSGVQAPAPLFSALLNYRHSPGGQMDVAQTWEGMQMLSGDERTNYPLILSVDDLGEEFALTAQVVASIEAKRICTYMHTALEHLADALETAPQTAVNRIEVLPVSELQQLLVDWNATETEYPQEKCIHELFESQAQKTPEAVAVVFAPNTPGAGDRQLTYAELNVRANQLAHFLRSRGVGPDVLVGICIERSLEMIVGLLGILKAGGAYVPLDPAYPAERLRFMLEDGSIRWVLTQAALRKNLEQITDTGILCLDTDWEKIAPGPTNNLAVHVDPANLAYIIYTSGSTGVPKGVGVTHRNVLRLILPENTYVCFSADEVFLQFAPLAFDASTFEIWGSLLNGARLIVFSGYIPTLTELAGFVQANEVTTLWLTAGLFHQMVDAASAGLSGVRQLLAGGDVLSVSHLRAAQEQWPVCRLINGYGPTESTTFTCCYDIASGFGASVPIGQPIANTQVYILDKEFHPVPEGVPGELYIAGDGLARGYFNRPDLTAEKFIPHPFSNIPDARMYKSGDLARYLPGGSIEYLGRIDSQVKVRGFRIELGEIEAALTALPEVREAAVLAREDTPGDKRLVAYLVAQAGYSLPEAAALRSRLAQSLPEYMLPAHFIPLEQLPLTPNGKIDRKALPAPDMLRSEAGYVAPRSPTEETLARIWADVLKLDKVGIHDNFFELGGHSLLATQIMSKARATFQVNLPIRLLFDAPEIEMLAIEIDKEMQNLEDVEL